MPRVSSSQFFRCRAGARPRSTEVVPDTEAAISEDEITEEKSEEIEESKEENVQEESDCSLAYHFL